MHKIDFKYAEMQLKLDSKRRNMANLAKKYFFYLCFRIFVYTIRYYSSKLQHEQ